MLKLIPAVKTLEIKKGFLTQKAISFEKSGLDARLAGALSKLRRYVKGPLICKPNAGEPVIGDDNLAHYPMMPEEFAKKMRICREAGAALLGGCCGTAPEFIAQVRRSL